MILDNFPNHLNEVTRFPQVYTGGKTRRRNSRNTRATKRLKRRNSKRSSSCKMKKNGKCNCKPNCKMCKRMNCSCKKCKK